MLIKPNTKDLVLLAVLVTFQVKAQFEEAQETNVSFEKLHLLDAYISEGASIGDVNGDNQLDIIAGSIWWEGPDFKRSYAYEPSTNFAVTEYASNFFTFPGHFDDDEWIDILQVGMPGTDSKWIQNPGKAPLENKLTPLQYIEAQKDVCNESPALLDIIGDEKKELLAFSGGRIVLGVAGREEGKNWNTLFISPYHPNRFHRFSHGLGAGDINNDGYQDVLEKNGWWEQPEDWDERKPWVFHEYPFSPEQGGAQMFAYDVDGDGDNDVVTSMNAHGYGFSWHEQINGQEGSIEFREHQIMTDSPEDNKFGVSFSQLHALDMVDLNNDSIPDIVTGKCYYAHNGHDPGAEDPAVLYWFKTFRRTDGGVDFIPYLIDDSSGVGRQISTGDLNKDRKADIVVSNKKGVFVFIQN